MNLRNSKFLKRIQVLRRISKEKVRREREQNQLDYQLENALLEQNGSYISSATMNKHSPENLENGFQGDKTSSEADDAAAGDATARRNGIIHLNDKCFRLGCPMSKIPKSNSSALDESPSIRSTKGSICVSNSRYAIIGKVSRGLGFKIVKETKMWNVLWTDSLPGVELYKNMKRFQQINHFPGMMEICRKDLLSRNLNRMLKLFPRDYKIFPKTWIFPADYGDAMNFATNHCKHKARTFIIKPDAGAQGRGIWLTNDLKTVNPTERMICQTYITKPLLIDGYKFDLRVYTLITSVDPLRIFVYNEGLARFATNKYSEPTVNNSADLFMHLTNYSVNKRNSMYDLCDYDDCGSKRTFSAVNNWLRYRNYNVDDFWSKIDDIIIKTVLSAWPMLKHNYHACFPSHDKIQACFEVLGFDILVDSKLKPYILEVNHSPSFHTNELVDRQVKKALIKDTLTLVSTPLADKKLILKEDRKRVKQRLLKARPGDTIPRLTSNQTSNVGISMEATKAAPVDGQISFDDSQDVECPLSPLAQQIAWEESHLGDYRRVMPPHNTVKLNYYCQFFALQNQASIYSETAASKKREEVAKQLRQKIEERRQKQLDLIHNTGRSKFEERRKKRASMPRSVLDKQRANLYKSQAHWLPGFISDAEERLRCAWLQSRFEILRDLKIIQLIFLLLHKSGNLNKSDILSYPELYKMVEAGTDIVNDY